MVDKVALAHQSIHHYLIGDSLDSKMEFWVIYQVLDVPEATSGEIVNDSNLMTLFQQCLC
jgi:hypothetical protein